MTSSAHIDSVGDRAQLRLPRAHGLSVCTQLGMDECSYDSTPYKESGASFPADSNLLTKTLTMKNLTFSLQI